MKRLLFLLLVVAAGPVNGQTQTFWPMGSGVNNKVYAIEEDAALNGLYAGGTFTLASGSPASYIAHWDGSVWSPLGGGTNYYVWDMTYFNGTLYVGGGFNTVNGTITAWGVATWDGTNWGAVGNGIHGEVYDLVKYNGNLYAAGFIDTLSGFNPGRGIVVWNGSTWSALGGTPGNGVSGPPGFRAYALQVYNNELYVGGDFVNANSMTVNNIAKWNGTAWSAVGSGTNGPVRCFGVHNGELYVGGEFTMANGTAVNRLAKLSGTTFSPVGGGTNGPVYAIGSYMNELYATGAFTMAGTTPVNNIARWDYITWKDLIGGLNFEGYCLTTINTDLFVGGFFSVIGTTITNNIAGWNITTGIGESDDPEAVCMFPNPASDHVYVEGFRGKAPASVILFDAEGRRYARAATPAPGINRFRVDVRDLSPGVYVVALQAGDRRRATRLVIE